MITLLLGGARSGKSLVAERLAATLPEPVTYVATSPPESVSADADLAARVAAHRARRPASWDTVEPGEQLRSAVVAVVGTLLIDGLGAWVAARPDFDVDIAGLCRVVTARGGDTVIVSDEAGLGVHPTSDAGRRFRDALGEVNQAVAAIADDVLLVVAGRTLRLERAGPASPGPGRTSPGVAGAPSTSASRTTAEPATPGVAGLGREGSGGEGAGRKGAGREGPGRVHSGVANPASVTPGGDSPGGESRGPAGVGLASAGPADRGSQEPRLEEWSGRR